MALNSALGRRCNAIRRNIKTLARSIRTSLAPAPPRELEVPAQRAILTVSKSLERHFSQLSYGAWHSIRCLATTVADTAESLACCVNAPTVTEAWDKDSDHLASDKDDTSAHVTRATFMAGNSKKPLLDIILADSFEEAFAVVKTEGDAECPFADCDSVNEGDCRQPLLV